MILTHGANSLTRGGDPIPFDGQLTNLWNFKSGSITDEIGGVSVYQYPGSTPTFTSNGIVLTLDKGVCLGVQLDVGDYFECIFHLGAKPDGDSYHIRCINAVGIPNSFIDVYRAFVIYRAYSYQDNWNTYWTSWQTGFSNDLNLFNGKKLGIHIKTATTFDVYVENEVVASNRTFDYIDEYAPYYAIGCNATQNTSAISLVCERVRLFRNCT